MATALAEDLILFVQTHLRTVWALRMMVAMRTKRGQSWTIDSLVKELRASRPLIEQLLPRFERLGLITQADEGGTWRWEPATPEIQQLADAVAEAYALTPFGVIQAIAEAPESGIQHFADAFRIRRN